MNATPPLGVFVHCQKCDVCLYEGQGEKYSQSGIPLSSQFKVMTPSTKIEIKTATTVFHGYMHPNIGLMIESCPIAKGRFSIYDPGDGRLKIVGENHICVP